MPINNYGVVKGRAFDRKRATPQAQHFQILLNRGTHPKRVAINTQSATPPSQVLYFANDNYHHEITDALTNANLPDGFTAIKSQAGGLALDFVRRNLFDTKLMVPLPADNPVDKNDLNDRLDFFVQQAIQDPSAVIYAFGQQWVDTKIDQYFPEINPSTGIHDIHLNQGNPTGSFYKDNGIWQDGGLLFHYVSRNRWAGVFTAFQSQTFFTDDRGNPTTKPKPKEGMVKIVAALVNPTGSDLHKEFVILLNKSSQDINLKGWHIADKFNKKDALGQLTIPAKSTLQVNLSGNGAQLDNGGGIITLLDNHSQKIDGVNYSKKDAGVEGTLVKF
jgi:uncharacterized protein YukJ